MAFTAFGKELGPSNESRPVVGNFGSTPRTTSAPSPSGSHSHSHWLPSFSFPSPYQAAGVERISAPSKRIPSSPVGFQNSHPSVEPYQSSGTQWKPGMQISSASTHGPYDLNVVLRPYQLGAMPRPQAFLGSDALQDPGVQVTTTRAIDVKIVSSPSSYPKDGGVSRSSPSNSQSYSDFHVGQSLSAPSKTQSLRSAFLGSHVVEEEFHPPVRNQRPSFTVDDHCYKSTSWHSDSLFDHADSNSAGGADMRDKTNAVSFKSPSYNKDFDDTMSAQKATKSFSTPKRARSPTVTRDGVYQDRSNYLPDVTEREEQAKAKRLARFRNELSYILPPADTVDSNTSTVAHQQPSQDGKIFPSVEPIVDAPELEILKTSSGIIGLCPDMCPASEREERERKGDLDQYERLDGDRNLSSKNLAVKKYNRTAEREANLIRPMPILHKTMDYLLNLLDHPYDEAFLGMYNFLWDRMRAIRMDLRMQHIFDRGAISMLEQMIRLHIIAMHELCEYTKGEGFLEGFDAHLNIEQMNKTSVELFQMYDDHRKKGQTLPTEKEFRGYYALLKLDKHPGYKVEPAELSLDLAKMTPEIRQAPEVRFARDVARACRTGNFIAFFRLARKATYLQACLMHAHFVKLRAQALAALHSGLQNNQGLPLSDVAEWIGMEEEDIESLLGYHGFSLKEFEEQYVMKDGPFLNAGKDYQVKCSRLVHLKKSRNIVEDVSPREVQLPMEAAREILCSPTRKIESKSATTFQKQSSYEMIDEEFSEPATFSLAMKSMPVTLLVQSPVETEKKQYQHMSSLSAPKGFIPSWNTFTTQSSSRYSEAKTFSTEKRDEHSSLLNEQSQLMDDDPMLIRLPPETLLQPNSVQAMPMHRTSSSHQENLQGNILKESLMQSVDNNKLEEEPCSIDQEEETDYLNLAIKEAEEVALAKLKLIIRLWRRWSSRHRKLREKRELTARIALDSLSFGPPIQVCRDQRSSARELDFDHVMGERLEKCARSWSRLNVSDVTMDILTERNQDARCLCWKVIVCSQESSVVKLDSEKEVSNAEASKWLLSKLMPPCLGGDTDNDLIMTGPTLSIWKKWVGQCVSDLICCLSVVRHVGYDNPPDAISGASSILFLTSETIPWSRQKMELHHLLTSIPLGAQLPLLIINVSSNRDSFNHTSDMTTALGLYDIDKSKVGCFLVLPMYENEEMLSNNGFFSDNRLKEGLRWLASNSPTQPALNSLDTRDLVLMHLKSSLGKLERMTDHELGPNLCIKAFNEALDQSLEKIVSSAETNQNNWPCPEIGLLRDSSPEHSIVRWHLPSIGWGSIKRIEPAKSALKDCKLPTFHDDLKWLGRGCSGVSEIENQRLRLESSLIKYLTETSQMMGSTLATKEVSVIVQRSARLEFYGCGYHIVPKWVMIFRRIFNWQLTRLANPALSPVYILASQLVSLARDELGPDDITYNDYNLSAPSLSEIIEGGYAPMKCPQELTISMLDHGGLVAANDTQMSEDGRETSQQISEAVEDNAYGVTQLETSSAENSNAALQGAHRLGELLEKCNIVQNKIAESLSIYF